MLDVGFSELVVIGVVALIVVGPRDLPAMFQTVGRFTARARSMAREFQRAMDDAAKASGMNEAMKDVRDLTSKKSLGLNALESAAEKFEKWKPMDAVKPAAKPPVKTEAQPDAAPAKTPEAAAEPAKTAGKDAAKPSGARKMGAHTRALADQIEKDRAERKARAAAKTATADATPAPEPAKPVKKAPRKAAPAPAAKVETATAVAAKPKAARKPRQGKTDA